MFCFCLFCFVSFVYPNLFDLQSKTPSPKTSINNNNNNNNNEKPQAPVSLDFLRSVPKSTPTTTGTSGSYQYQMRRRLVNWSKKPIQCLSICHILIKFRFCTVLYSKFFYNWQKYSHCRWPKTSHLQMQALFAISSFAKIKE